VGTEGAEVAGNIGQGKQMRIIHELLVVLSPGATVKDISQGPFQTAVLTRACGLASTPHENSHHQGDAAVKEAGQLRNKTASELANMALSPNPFEAAIGMATINSLIDVEERWCVEVNAADLLVERGEGRTVALIGHFPFVPRLRQAAKRLWVIEKHPRQDDIAESEAESLIPQAEVVAITGSAFINHTIEHLLALCNPKAYILVLGGTTPLSPILFDYGVDAISGTKVIDADMVLRYVSQGATFRQIRGIRLLTMLRERVTSG
jgi:uncharacterized protein (DUF4213/DUF364 family)